MQRTEFTLFLGEDLPRQSSSRAIGSLENHEALPFLECVDFVGELSGVDEASKDVVGEVAESKRDSAEVF